MMRKLECPKNSKHIVSKGKETKRIAGTHAFPLHATEKVRVSVCRNTRLPASLVSVCHVSMCACMADRLAACIFPERLYEEHIGMGNVQFD